MKILILLVIIAGVAGYYYHTHPNAINQAKDTVTTVKTSGAIAVDAVTTTSFGGVGADAQVYYLKNRNYGTSTTKNICADVTSNEGFGDIISAIKKVGNVVTCTVDSKYPSKSFTITVPSLQKKGQFYCTDQNGFVGIIPSITAGGSFAAGLQCK